MIRPATPLDGAALAAIYNPYVRDTVITFETEEVGADEMAERVRRLRETHPWLVFELDGAVLGYAYGGPWRPRQAYRFATETTVYVAQGQGRRGIGGSLYRALIPELRARGLHIALGGIALPNEASVALHERMGFRQVGRLPAVGWKLGRWVDVGYWALELQA